MAKRVLVRLIAKGITNQTITVTSSPFHYVLVPFVKDELKVLKWCIAQECGVSDREVELVLEEPAESDTHWQETVGIIISFHADFEQVASDDTNATNFVHMLITECVQLRALTFVVLVSCGKVGSSCLKYDP
ncbi:MAG: hypothetical protein RLZZ76_494 [Candidatus Parcubacteria bacterium]